MASETEEFMKELESKFPNCTFIRHGKKITILGGGCINGIPAVYGSRDDDEYEFGIHRDLIQVLEEKDYFSEIIGDSILITKY